MTLPNPVVRAHQHHTFGAARGLPVLPNGCPLTEAVLRDGQDQIILAHNFDANDVIAFREIHGANSTRWTAHCAHLIFLEPDRHALMRSKEHEVVDHCEASRDQFIPVIQRQRNYAAGHRVIEFGQLALLDDAMFSHHHDVLVFHEFLDWEEGLDGLIRHQIDQAVDILSFHG
jgi:hypothetical protein